MGIYKVLNKQEYRKGDFSIVPIRMDDRYAIMKWRNEQMFHLRQNQPLSEDEQDKYFNTIVAGLFNQEQPSQILFSYLEGDKCIGYGGLVHINWIDKNAEISFIMDTLLESNSFNTHWKNFLYLIEEVGLANLGLHKIFIYAFDLRPHLYEILSESKFFLDARLKEHCLYKGKFIDVVIYSKTKVVLI